MFLDFKKENANEEREMARRVCGQSYGFQNFEKTLGPPSQGLPLREKMGVPQKMNH